MRKPLLIAAIIITPMLLISGLGALFVIFDTTTHFEEPKIEMDGINVVISVKVDPPLGVHVKDTDLVLVSGSLTKDITVEDNTGSVSLNPVDLARIIANGSVSVQGSVEASVILPFIVINRDIDEEIDLASVTGFQDSFIASNIDVVPNGLSDVVVSMDFDTDQKGDLEIDIHDAKATLTTPLGTTEVYIEDMVMDEDGSGEVSIKIPLSAVTPLTSENNTIVVEVAGITFSFDYPV